MGNQIVSDQELTESFQDQYFLQEQPYLMRKSTSEPFTLHKVTANSPEQTARALETVQKYHRSRCGSISRLKEHYHRKNRSYCSDQENIYFLFYDHGRTSLKDQYLMRRFMSTRFSPREIKTSMETMLCGLREYHTNFHRQHSQFSLEAVCIEPGTHRLYIRDPWLVPHTSSTSFTNVLLSYPSAEKLNTLYYDKDSFYDEYYSTLFTVGMYGLQIYYMEFMDDVYDSKKKRIDIQRLNGLIDGVNTDPHLQNGLRTLLQERPNRRQDIFSLWHIDCPSIKKLEKLVKDIDNTSNTRMTAQNTATEINDPKNFLNTVQLSPDLRGSRIQRPPWIQPIDVRTPLPINSSHFDTPNYSNNYPLHGFPFNEPQGSLRQQQMVKNGHPNGTQYGHTKSALNLGSHNNQIHPYLVESQPHRPQNLQSQNIRPQPHHYLSQNKPDSQSTLNRQESNHAPRLLNIQRPDQKYKQEVAHVHENTTHRQDTPGFQRISPSMFKKAENKYHPQPYVSSFDSMKIKESNSLTQSTQPLDRSVNISFNTATKSVTGHSSSLQKTQTGKQQIDVSRPRSISNQVNLTNSLLVPTKSSGVSFNSTGHEWKGTNNKHNVTVNMVQIEPKYDPLQENPYRPFKPVNISTQQSHKQSAKSMKENSIAANLHVLNKELNSLATNAKEPFNIYHPQFKMNSNVENARPTFEQLPQNAYSSQTTPVGYDKTSEAIFNNQNKSPIQQWKNNDDYKKADSPVKKPLEKEIPYTEENRQPEKENTRYDDTDDQTIYTEIKSYAQSLLGFRQAIDAIDIPKNYHGEYSQSTNKDLTPPRPTGRGKYNSTIVEVNEETPEQSESSAQGEIEYVVEEYETGSRYQGEKMNGMRSGRGKFFYQDGGHYQGEWKKNKMHGWGKLYYEGGRLAYEGHWSHDEFHGYGKVYNDNPISLTAPFDYTNFDLLDDYWIYYEGTLVSDTKQGRGKIKLTNGETFEGDFHADRIQGFGKYYTIDGNFIEGIWRQSKLIKVLNTS